MCYINTTLAWRQVGYIGDSIDDLRPHVYADADLASCAESQRSTSGSHMAVQSENNDFPMIGKSLFSLCIAMCDPDVLRCDSAQPARSASANT